KKKAVVGLFDVEIAHDNVLVVAQNKSVRHDGGEARLKTKKTITRRIIAFDRHGSLVAGVDEDSSAGAVHKPEVPLHMRHNYDFVLPEIRKQKALSTRSFLIHAERIDAIVGHVRRTR